MARRVSLTAWRVWGPWPAVAAALALGMLALHGQVGEAWRWQPELAFSQPWRLITAAWVHGSARHEMANLAGCGVVAAFGLAAGCQSRATLAWLLAWPLTHLALLAQPALLSYGGLSGVLHAGVAVAAWQLACTAPGHPGGRSLERGVGLAVLAGLVMKVISEAPWAGATQHVPGWDIAIAPMAHAAGAVAGVLCAALLRVHRTARG